ncbi:MAG: DUF599 domain-containing protein [Pseudoruegeria sp.]
MNLISSLAYFTTVDVIAVALIWLCWLTIGIRIESGRLEPRSVSYIMRSYRREWMVQFITRQPRIFDASILASLRQGTTFFASACMIAIGAGFALIGNTERLLGIAEDFTLQELPALVWETKILMALIFVVNAFLKFVWSHRLFGYCSVVMAAVPNDENDPTALPRARQAAELNITGARAYNRGLRSMYFAIAALTWLISPIALLMAGPFTFLVLWRREFSSHSRTVILQNQPTPPEV